MKKKYHNLLIIGKDSSDFTTILTKNLYKNGSFVFYDKEGKYYKENEKRLTNLGYQVSAINLANGYHDSMLSSFISPTNMLSKKMAVFFIIPRSKPQEEIEEIYKGIFKRVKMEKNYLKKLYPTSVPIKFFMPDSLIQSTFSSIKRIKDNRYTSFIITAKGKNDKLDLNFFDNVIYLKKKKGILKWI